MNQNLRPLALGEILDRTFQLYRQRFLVFLGAMAIPSLCMLAFRLADLRWWHLSTKFSSSLGLTQRAGAIWVNYGLYHISAALQLIFIFSVAWLVQGSINGESRGSAGSLRFLFSRPWRAIWLAILKMLIVILGPEAVVISIGTGMGYLFNRLGAFDSGMNLFPALCVILVPFTVFVALYCWLGPRLSLAIPVAVVEDHSAWKSVVRGWKLSRDGRRRLFIAWMLIFILTWVSALGVEWGYRWIWDIATSNPFKLRTAFNVGLYVLSALVGTLLAPIYPIALTLLYYDQRIRREGFDVEWMMQSAGLVPAPPTAEPPSAAPVEDMPA